MSNKLRWAKWFWSDWSDDPALALCSHAAQSIWVRLMCIAAQGTPYGHVTINGSAPSIKQLAKLMRPALRPDQFERRIAELIDRGVAARTADGTLFSRRMMSDWRLSDIRSTAAMKGLSGSHRSKDGRFCSSKNEVLLDLEGEGESESRIPPARSPAEQGTATPHGGDPGNGDGRDLYAGEKKTRSKREVGTNPRTLGTNPRAAPRQRSRNAWIDHAMKLMAETQPEDANGSDTSADDRKLVDATRRVVRG